MSEHNTAEHTTPETGRNESWAVWATRAAFSLVFLLNIQCALQFVIVPGAYTGAYQLSGVSGEAAVRGLGIAFLMWNATYPAFIASPQRFRILGWVILAQQVIGLVGESALLLSLPAEYETLSSSIARFIAFDAAGLILMAACWAAVSLTRHRAR